VRPMRNDSRHYFAAAAGERGLSLIRYVDTICRASSSCKLSDAIFAWVVTTGPSSCLQSLYALRRRPSGPSLSKSDESRHENSHLTSAGSIRRQSMARCTPAHKWACNHTVY